MLTRAELMKKYGMWLIYAVIVGILLMFGFRFLEVMMVRSMYSSFFKTIQEASGLPDKLAGAVAVWLVFAVLALIPIALSAVIRKKVKKMAWLAAAFSLYMVLLYVLSLPREGNYFNTATGTPWYKYAREADGNIVLRPLGEQYYSRTGEKLQFATLDVIKEYEKQQQKLQKEREKEAAKHVQVIDGPSGGVTIYPSQPSAHGTGTAVGVSASVPSPSPVVPAELKEVRSDIDRRNNLDFELDGCVIKSDKIGCFFWVTNRGTKEIPIFLKSDANTTAMVGSGSYLIDDQGATFFATSSVTGYSSSTRWDQVPYNPQDASDLPLNVRIRSLLVFEHITTGTKKLQDIRVIYSTSQWNISQRYIADFKNIRLRDANAD